ncbi:hypothetical protein [Microvirga tunisiensis]|uniref:Uncharacterized protein n=1 Tax=Microvirga tunisiensis TaxID=2108360 RepID=A0A5N7MYE5_9HYPH|nr:hypothetical protein [Microvirga tunisiensis]MPR13162.1 hypothetical protein [Microvirga tunisiensis]MPR31044.1 hypothetical protein [Microvirga tunisiensis]
MFKKCSGPAPKPGKINAYHLLWNLLMVDGSPERNFREVLETLQELEELFAAPHPADVEGQLQQIDQLITEHGGLEGVLEGVSAELLASLSTTILSYAAREEKVFRDLSALLDVDDFDLAIDPQSSRLTIKRLLDSLMPSAHRTPVPRVSYH